MNILEEAKEVTSGNRQEDYGMPEDSFRGIADYWTVYLDSHEICRRISPTDVAKMMILLKIAREDYRHKRDNLVDIAGYARTLSQIEGDEDNQDPMTSTPISTKLYKSSWDGPIRRRETREPPPSQG